jgi:hypothetical protein
VWTEDNKEDQRVTSDPGTQAARLPEHRRCEDPHWVFKLQRVVRATRSRQASRLRSQRYNY